MKYTLEEFKAKYKDNPIPAMTTENEELYAKVRKAHEQLQEEAERLKESIRKTIEASDKFWNEYEKHSKK